MARIKSALELALERTDSVKGDKSSLEEYNLKQAGKKIASAFLGDPEGKQILGEIKAYPKDQQETLRATIAETLLANLTLPAYKDQIDQVDVLAKGLEEIVVGKQPIKELFSQIKKLFSQYFEDIKNLEAALVKQYMPRLKQKEQELARRSGQPVTLEPMQDPEFVRAFNQNLNQMRDQYEAGIEEAHARLRQMFALPEKDRE